MTALLRLLGGAGVLGLSPLLVSVATLVSVPVVLANLGSEVWLSIAVGQAVGEMSRAVVVWGWNSIGLSVVAALDPRGRTAYYLDSLAPRLLLLVPVLVVGLVLTQALPLADPWAATLMAATGAVYGLNAAWAFIGGREPGPLLLWDSSPRAASTVIAAGALYAVPAGWVFGSINLLGSLVAVAVPFVVMLRRGHRNGTGLPRPRVRETLDVVRRGFPAFVAGFVLVLRMSVPVVVAPMVVPGSAVAVALGDKFLRWMNTAMTPLMQAIQARVPIGPRTVREKVGRALRLAWSFGPVVACAVALVIPPASALISHGDIALGLDVALPVGIVCGLVFVAALTGNSALVLLGKVKVVALGATGALLVLAVVFVPMTRALGASGAFWAFALAEAFVTVFQLVVVRRALADVPDEAVDRSTSAPALAPRRTTLRRAS